MSSFVKGIALSLLISVGCAAPASAQDAGRGHPVNTDPDNVNPKGVQGTLRKPASEPGFSGPLAGIFAPLAERGLTFHTVAMNFFTANPSVGLDTDHSANSLYLYVGADADLGKIAGLNGLSLHYEHVFFPLTRNLNMAPQIGDSKVGYQPAFTPRGGRLSRATIQGKTADGKLDIELGVTHPAYYYALANCDAIAACFQTVLYTNSGWTSYSFAVPGANISAKLGGHAYAQAGVFAVESGANFRIGYDVFDTDYAGTLVMGEVGVRTSFADTLYPYSLSLTGYRSSARHNEFLVSTATTGLSRAVKGTDGFVVQAEKVVWRADGGTDKGNRSPTALKLFSSVGVSTDRTTPVQANAFFGATLLSPIPGRNDRISVKIDWERISSNFRDYITAANGVAGGPGPLSPYKKNNFVLGASAHVELPLGMAVEPIAQYAFSPNSYYNPTSPVKAQEGLYLGLNFIVPIGTIAGVSAHN